MGGRHTAVCKTIAKASKVRILLLPPSAPEGAGLRTRESGAFVVAPSRVRATAAGGGVRRSGSSGLETLLHGHIHTVDLPCLYLALPKSLPSPARYRVAACPGRWSVAHSDRRSNVPAREGREELVVSVSESAPATDHDRVSRPVGHNTPRVVVREVAVPTADHFASLAERGAALVDRQHGLLDALQGREEDPERLAGLFRLDHLAAQLRRNSNAALVLAGLPTVRSIHSPTLLSELVCAAVSEVDGYQRVKVGALPTRRVQARVASDLVHLLGDLLENALAASPRASGVWVRGEPRRPASTDTSVLIRVGDSGTGVSETDLRRLNDLLTGRPTDSRRAGVGLVVSREIARRHSLAVRLDRLVSGGLVATVALPDAVFESESASSTNATAWTFGV